MDRLRISLLIFSEYKLLFPLKSSENLKFLMISGGIEVNKFVYIRLMFQVKFGDDP